MLSSPDGGESELGDCQVILLCFDLSQYRSYRVRQQKRDMMNIVVVVVFPFSHLDAV